MGQLGLLCGEVDLAVPWMTMAAMLDGAQHAKNDRVDVIDDMPGITNER